MTNNLQGVELVQAVIELVRSNGFAKTFGRRFGGTFSSVAVDHEPRPIDAEILDEARLDGDMPLTPSLRAWLSFDGSLCEWIDNEGEVVPRTLVELAEDDGELVAPAMTILSRPCYPLPFSGRKAYHFLYPSKPDAIGELPVLSAEPDNSMVGITYPGLDVFLGYFAGIVPGRKGDWFAERLAEHEANVLGGKQMLDLDELAEAATPKGTGLPPGVSPGPGGKYMLEGDGAVPEGFAVVRELVNPFTKAKMRVLERR